jgi:hypothetical protein
VTCDAWIALQAVASTTLLAPHCIRAHERDVVDVRDPLIDLTTCPTCGTDLTLEKTG